MGLPGKLMNVDQDCQLTGVVIGAAIAAHRELGPGLDEAAYEQALSARLTTLRVAHTCQKPLPLIYKGATLDAEFRLDVLVDSRLLIELKAVETLLPIHEAQLLTYMRLSKLPLGLLINFDVAVLKEGIRRRVLTHPKEIPISSVADIRDGFDPLSAELLHAASEVHRTLGPGLLRSAYEECFCYELSRRRIDFVRKHQVPLHFEGTEILPRAEIPLLVAGQIPVFCLAVAQLTKLNEIRLLARMRQVQSPYGFLLNFNSPILAQGIRRLTSK